MMAAEFFTFDTGRATDVGCVREINEDSNEILPESGLWVVADGMGGHAAGDYASQTIVGELGSIGVPSTPDDLQARFMERLTRAHHAIRDHAETLGQGSIGATVAALLIHGVDYACLWSGDSRVYRVREGVLTQQTRDHTEVMALLDSGVINEEEARNWPRKNVITRAVGVSELPEIDVVSNTLEGGDVFCLCSDGLTEHLEDHEIAAFLSNPSAQGACDAMVAQVIERGAKDNVTVIVVRCSENPERLEAEVEDGHLIDGMMSNV